MLFFISTYLQCHLGEVRLFERSTGKDTELAENVHTEDTHRVSCQQWLSGGKRETSHEVIEKNWRVVVLDVETLKKKIVAASSASHHVPAPRPEPTRHAPPKKRTSPPINSAETRSSSVPSPDHLSAQPGACLTFAISRSSIPCITCHFAGSASVLPA